MQAAAQNDLLLLGHCREKRGRGRWLVECCFTSTETVGLLGTGAQDSNLDFYTAPELCTIRVG